MSNGHSSCGIFGIFLGFLTGVIWLLLLGEITDLLAVFNLGIVATVLIFLIKLIGLLAFLIFGLYVFKKVWHCCKK